MNKEIADKLILEYQKKIFGFALSKLQNLSEAEELASNITCEVYQSLLCAGEIVNFEGYVYRVASNVFARFLQQKKQESHADIMDISLPFHDKGLDRMENNETMAQLRREVSLLSRMQRVVIYLHYYKNQKIKEIAAQLRIPEGTVKWHLSDARTALKEDLTMNNNTYKNTNTDNLKINPIFFATMGHSGRAGEKGDTKDFFDTRLKQNIAWCCYYNGHTIEEIARILELPAVYIADEMQTLEEYGYIDRISGGANPIFRTNMMITDSRISAEPENALYREAAAKLCDEFYPQIFADFEKSQDFWGFRCADNDVNFMKYNLALLCAYSIVFNKQENGESWETYAVKRPDGGIFTAVAVVSDDCYTDEDDPYWACGYMVRKAAEKEGTEKIGSVQLDCKYSRRWSGWRDNCNSDWDNVYTFISNHGDIHALPIEGYKRLCDKGYLINDKLQVMHIQAEKEGIDGYLEKVIREHVAVPAAVTAYAQEFDNKMYELKKQQYPEHMHPILRFYNTNCLNNGKFVPYLIEELLKRKMLLPLTDEKKMSVFTAVVYK